MDAQLSQVFKTLNGVILGKSHEISLALSCILAGGHVLLEDVPGVGKTTLAHALARVLGLSYKRVQFTNDMLPSDLLGVSIFQPNKGEFQFQPGPVFHHLLLADEINRASPKLQSALLEAMEERQVSIDGKTYLLPRPFFVIATQNPSEQVGTFPLPESQLDRFMMRLSLGYPSEDAEKYLYQYGDRRLVLKNIPAILNAETILALQKQVRTIKVSDALLDYVYRLIVQTRQVGVFLQGLSPRSGLSVIAAAKAWAYLQDRAYVLPEDVQTVFVSIAAHRLHSFKHGDKVTEVLVQMMKNAPIDPI